MGIIRNWLRSVGNRMTRKSRTEAPRKLWTNRCKPGVERLEDRVTPAVLNQNSGEAFATFQAAIDDAQTLDGHTLFAQNGTYFESNIQVSKDLTITGQSRAGVIVAPAINDDNLDSSFGGVFSHGFIIQSDGVTIQNLTVDGDANPTLIPGRNNYRAGIITDFNFVPGPFNTLTVQNVTVDAVYRRGIQLSDVSTGNLIDNNSVNDVELVGSGFAIASFGGDGTISNNVITNAANGIAANFADPGNGLGAPLLAITGNQITVQTGGVGMNLNGLRDASTVTSNIINLAADPLANIGIIVAFSRGTPTIQNNQITGAGSDTGIALWSNLDANRPTIMGNTITTTGSLETTPGSGVGILVTDDVAVSGDAFQDSFATILENTVTGFVQGIDLRDNALAGTMTAASINKNTVRNGGTGLRVRTGATLEGTTTQNFFTGHTADGILIDAGTTVGGPIMNNDLSGNTGFGLNNLSAVTINAECNWWGSNTRPGVQAEVNGLVDFDPWLATGTDTEPANPGFQGNLALKSSGEADLSVTKTDSPDFVLAGSNITYTITVANAGPSDALGVTLTDNVPTNTTFVSFAAPAGWTTTMPAVGGTGPVTATRATLAAGAPAQVFTLVVRVNANVADGTLISNTATIASTTDPVDANNMDTETTMVRNRGLFATGTATSSSQVRVFDAMTRTERFNFFAYAGFDGGVNVTIGDITGDGFDDIITGAGPGGGPHVKVFDGQTGAQVRSFFAFVDTFSGGVNVASGDVNNDGFDDIIVGAGPGASPHVKVFSGQTGAEIASFFAYDPAFAGGVRVATGDVNNDDFGEVITAPGPNGSGQVNVINGMRLNQVQANGQILGTALVRSHVPYAGFAGGIFVASGDVDGDGFSEVFTGAGAGAGPHVKVFSGQTGAEIASFFAYDQAFTGGVMVAATDRDGDGLADILTGAGPGAGPHVRIFDGATLLQLDSFFAFAQNYPGGVTVGGPGI